MKAFLLYKDQDFDLKCELPPGEQALTQDLALNTLFGAMAPGDGFLLNVARKAVFSSLTDPDAILYRQDILRDSLKHPAIVKSMYDTAVEAIEREKKDYWGIFLGHPSSILHRSVDVLRMFVSMLKRLKAVADEHAQDFESEDFTRFFAMIKDELGDEYFARIEEHLKTLKFRGGVLISAQLGKGNTGINYVLRKPHNKKRTWVERIFRQKQGYTFQLHPRGKGSLGTGG